MPTRGLMLPTREIGPRLSDKSKSRRAQSLAQPPVQQGGFEWSF